MKFYLTKDEKNKILNNNGNFRCPIPWLQRQGQRKVFLTGRAKYQGCRLK